MLKEAAMAMDIRIVGNYRVRMGTLLRRQVLALFHVAIILSEAVASPVWMPQFLSGGQGRSIRHLPCVSRRTGEQGICMFAYTCLKSNGTHLGTCIDRFYFGSCCKLAETDDLMVDNHFPAINNNRVTLPYYPSTGSTYETQAISIQNQADKIAATLFPTSSKISYPPTVRPSRPETSTNPLQFSGTVPDPGPGTIVDLAQHLATETYFVPQTTDSVFHSVPVSSVNATVSHSPKPSVPPSLGSGSYGGAGKPSFAAATTRPYLLSTFQVVHGQNGITTPRSPTIVPPAATTPRPASAAPPSTAELVSTWTPARPQVSTPATVVNASAASASKPTRPTTTTTKKPSKPAKPYVTTRKPTTKKPAVKPSVKPTPPTTSKPSTVSVKITTSKPTAPVKKPTQPTKKPSSSKPPTTKPSGLSTRPSSKPTSSSTVVTTATTPHKTPATTVRYPPFSTYVDTTSEVVFTKPGYPTKSNQTSGYGITTFRPDLVSGTGGTEAPSTAASGLTTFSYVSEGVKDTTVRPPETTTFRYRPTKPGDDSSTVKGEAPSTIWSSSGTVAGGGQTVIYQQIGSTVRPAAQSTMSSVKPVSPSVPFFPDAEKPQMPTQWIEMVQTSTRPAGQTSPAVTASVTDSILQPTTVAAIFDGLNQSDYTQVCGRRIYPQARVVGGEKSTFGKWPWQISLRQWRTSTYLHKCGAALLNENWAITAAHCVENVPPSDLLLRLGEHDLSTEDEPFGFQERRVQIVASHPQFDPRTFEYDLALLRFYEPVKFQPNIIPVCVPEDDTNFVGQTAFVTGWGRLYEDGPLPSVLQEVSVPVINNTLCENMYRSAGYIEHIPEIFICAGWKKGGFDSCEGDSGGPMVIQRADKRWLLAGVISWGIGCAEPNQPGVYTRISEFREWIHQILQF